MSADYKWIRHWGAMMGSQPFYVDAQVERARKEHAPENAIYRDLDGWKTTADISSSDTVRRLESIAGESIP